MVVLLTVLSASLSAAPMGFSVNSDSPSNELSDSLYQIDLATGNSEWVGIVQSTSLQRRIDVEGLAFSWSPDGKTLYGIDDDSLKLFVISQENALVDPAQDYDISELTSGSNDFGMTFACDEQLYVSSVTEQSLYRLDTEGHATLVGGPQKGKLGKNISALAAYGFPVQLYGMGNGTVGDNATSTPTLFRIDTITGVATKIAELSGSFGDYAESGLAFDEAGILWAMTDRRPLDLPSQIMQIDTTTGAVSNVQNVATTDPDSAMGFESLAITGPSGCTSVGNGRSATFFVQNRFDDGNDETPVTLNFQCTGGTVFNGTKTLSPSEALFGIYEVSFTVSNIPDAPISCEVSEVVPTGYEPEYSCESESSCSTNEGAGPCTFEGISDGQQDLCLITNKVKPVELTVTKEWNLINEETMITENARIELTCSNVIDGDGEAFGNSMRWSWIFEGNPASKIATLYPRYDGTTRCVTDESAQSSSIESESTCSTPTVINVGDDKPVCVVTNTVFFEGIPTLNQYGLLLITVLTLMTGMAAVRRLG